MKRSISLLLAVLLMLTALPVTMAAEELSYGEFPIYIGYTEVDYMADQVLTQIPLEGKDDWEKIQAVYDWIILNCERYEWDGTLYFDEAEIQANLEEYGQRVQAAIDNGQAVIRLDFTGGGSEFMALNGYTNRTIARCAYNMFMTRTGNCMEFASMLAVLLGHLGYDARMIPGLFINSPTDMVEHKWNYVLVDGQYYWLDVRIDHATYQRTGSVAHDFFMWSDTEQWAQYHDWERSFSDRLAENAGEVIDIYNELCHAHALVWKEQQPATCDEAGWMEHYYCTECGMMFQDEAAYIPVDAELLALGHEWSEWEAVKPVTFEEYGILQRVCQRDESHVQTKYLRAEGNPFVDVPAAEYYETPVVWAVAQQVTKGMTETTFEPEGKCTRAQVVTFLYRAAGSPEVEGVENPFADVAEGTWYTDAVLWAVSQGITTGMSATTFEPDGKCTRAQVVTFLHRAKGSPETQVPETAFRDVVPGSWYENSVNWAVTQGITTGMGGGIFSPDGICTRGQVVTFLYRAREESAE